MGKSASAAFTLIELLVVLAIMVLIGTYVLANYSSFGEDQNLKNAVLDIQSYLRTAQANATTKTKCNTRNDATWQVEFANATTVNLKCQEPPASSIPKKTLTLGTNITILSVSGIDFGCPTAPLFTTPPTISFAPVSGKINLGGANCTSLTITLRNTKTSSTKSLIIEQGGRIYEQ